MRRRTGLAATAAVAATAVTAGVLMIGRDGQGADAKAGKSATPPATTTINRTDLVQSKTVDGRLDYAQRRTVKSPVEGTVTKAGEVDREVRMGQRLYERDARPITLMYGPTPAFRDMKVGDRGPDVLQLERNLRDLGFGAGLYIDTRYDKNTEAAVKKWQKSLGIENPSGSVGQGDVVFQPGPVRVVSADAALADRIGPAQAVLTVASTKPVVRADLDRTDTALTRSGTQVEVALGSGKTVRGKVSGTVNTPASGEAGNPGRDGITVEVALDGGGSAVSAEDPKATVSVTFVSESRTDVLVVPVEAVVALRGENGGYGLKILENGGSRMVRVETGMTADGRIEVSGSGLADGMTVETARP
ncbi:peptidoglycan-binding domain-containing protein [Streptomyces sp. NPDC002054]|uniref:peptidoglycan-binding domain-containing protein n=1 Tax=Streptomyces sp. NPDC002054 TaxID=3154663 RepID=UPI00331E251D